MFSQATSRANGAQASAPERARRWRWCTLVTPALLAMALAGMFAAPAPASHTPVGEATFPGSNNRCGSGQKTFLRQAWQEAYSYTKRAEQLVDHIASQPTEDQRRQLWEQEFAGYEGGENKLTASPQRFFGAYNRERLGRVQSVLEDARRRYEGKTMYLITCSTVCAKEKTTPAHHAVKGRIVTCSLFWSLAKNAKSHAQKLAQAAFALTHETLHHVFVKVNGVWAAVGDYHGDGVGGQYDEKYYGIDDVTTLAREKANWAVRNNDSYAYFAQQANAAAHERFIGVYADKESAGTGGMFRDLTWAQLNERKATQAANGQYLADVETYVRGGQRLYAALWRIGGGDGTLTQNAAGPFREQRKAIERQQDLIDVEVYRNGNGDWTYLGVFRKRAADAKGVGALQVGLSWQQLFARQGEYAKLGAYLADVETYVENATRRFVGVWRVGPGAGAMAHTSDEGAFEKIRSDRVDSQQLIDLERYRAGGKLWFIGVWRHAPHGQDYVHRPWTELVSVTLADADWSTLIDIEENSTMGMEY